jgi:sulfite reductase (NADPH) flavoprotein alpha-component
MTRSLWRYSHLVLALSSALFLVIASATGGILAFEPITKSIKNYDVVSLKEVSLAQVITALQNEQIEVLKITITSDEFVTASLVNERGEMAHHYIHPTTGELLGKVAEKLPVFRWVTNLHRSLFLKGLGRFFVGLVSLLLCFIAVTGLLLLAQRQGGFLKLYSKVRERDFNQRYHVIFGRWLLLPLIIIAATGVYLSVEKFNLLPENSQELDWSVSNNSDLEHKPITQQKFFAETNLSDVRNVNFPFSENESDYYEITLRDRDVLVHQYSGAILSEISHPFTQLASRWSLQLHTGDGSLLWSIILAISSASVLFFIFSGISMYVKRRKKKETSLVLNTIDESEIILFVGSETGNTVRYASAFAKAIKAIEKRVAITTLNEYRSYPKAKYIVVFTATYGNGDAPSNARKFEHLIGEVKQTNPIQFGVVGFGSTDYPKYCQFAIKVDGLLHSNSNLKPVHPLVKINNQSDSAFEDWVHTWNVHTGMNLEISLRHQKRTSKKKQFFTVMERTALNIENTALLRLRPKKGEPFQSGDLLNVIPPEDKFARPYSIAKIGGDILLSIKWHPKGVCSSYLCTLKKGDTISAKIENNVKFHFPKQAASVWLVANGTGIAPYLGMLHTNTNISTKLTWGGRTEASFDCYRGILETSLSRKQIDTFQFAFSEAKEKNYVQDILQKQHVEVAKMLREGGVFMLCGSLAMQNAVLDTLDGITRTQLEQPLSDFENNGQLLMDCY